MSDVNGRGPIVIAPMEVGDIPQVVEIDRRSFPAPWSAASYRFELTQNQTAYFIVALAPPPAPKHGWIAKRLRPPPARFVVGYAGGWLIVDEVHISTLATHPDWRRQGIGERLLVCLLYRALERGALDARLEVRVGNVVAQRLYQKYGFEEVGRRKRYYRNGEEAVLMSARLEGAVRERILDQYRNSVLYDAHLPPSAARRAP